MTVKGQLAAQDPADQKWYTVDNQTVTLERKQAGEDAFVSVGDAVTEADGTVTFTTPATKNAQYLLSYAGGEHSSGITLAAADSTVRGVKVYRNLHERTYKKSGKVYFAGNVDPGWGGKTIHLEKKACASCSWKAYAQKQTTASGGWTFLTPAPKSGKWRWRTWVAATTDYQKTTSAVLVTYTTYL